MICNIKTCISTARQIEKSRYKCSLSADTHTFASCYLENGGNVFSLQQILGHTSLEMTRRYVHLTTPENVKNFRLCSPLDKLAI
ncbi:MAG: tyrosine-type recombinase/integrase [Ruthenibacterium sp.]